MSWNQVAVTPQAVRTANWNLAATAAMAAIARSTAVTPWNRNFQIAPAFVRRWVRSRERLTKTVHANRGGGG